MTPPPSILRPPGNKLERSGTFLFEFLFSSALLLRFRHTRSPMLVQLTHIFILITLPRVFVCDIGSKRVAWYLSSLPSSAETSVRGCREAFSTLESRPRKSVLWPCGKTIWSGVRWALPKYSENDLWTQGESRYINASNSHLNFLNEAKAYLGIKSSGKTAPNNQFWFPDTKTRLLCSSSDGHQNVFITDDKEQVKSADFVLLDYAYPALHFNRRLLPELNNSQLLVLSFTGESVAYHPALQEDFMSLFNITLGYHRGFFDFYARSDLIGFPGSFIPRRRTDFLKSHLRKTSVSAFISNCKAKNNRLEYLRGLMQHLSVDSYGECLQNARVPESVMSSYGYNKSTSTSYYSGDYRGLKQHIISSYTFYLAFENSNCYEYVTEKIYDALMAGAIPVYMGARNIDEFVPPNSYVDVSRFPVPSDLAVFLRSASSNQTILDFFHAWRKEPSHFEKLKKMSLMGDSICDIIRHSCGT